MPLVMRARVGIPDTDNARGLVQSGRRLGRSDGAAIAGSPKLLIVERAALTGNRNHRLAGISTGPVDPALNEDAAREAEETPGMG